MKKIYIKILFLSLVLTLVNCNSTKLIPKDRRIDLDLNNLSSINGSYNNNSNDTGNLKETTFWTHLKPFPSGTNNNKKATQNSTIELKILEKNKIQFTLLDNNSNTKAVKTFKIVCKDGIILIKNHKNKKLEGIPLIFFRQHNETLNLGLDKNSNLILSYNGSASGGLLIVIFGEPIMGTNVFLRK